MNQYLAEWAKVYHQREEDIKASSTDAEREAVLKAYDMWKWTFPKALTGKTEEDLKKIRREHLQERIDLLQQELKDLDD